MWSFFVINTHVLIESQAAQAHNARSYIVSFFYFFGNAQRNVTSGIYYYTTIEFDFAKRNSRLAAYGGVVLQRFEFINVCMGTQRFCWKTQFCLYFVNKIYLPCCCVVFFSVCQLLRRVIVLWVSTAKRKTRLHTDFPSARHSKRINPLKISLLTQFLRRIEEEMFKLHVSSLATQFRPQCLRYDTFISRLLRSQLQR